MSWVKRLAKWKITPEWLDVQFGRLSCFAAAPLLLGFAFRAIGQHATTPAEAMIGMLAAFSTALLLVILGLVLPLASTASPSSFSENERSQTSTSADARLAS